jgi:hypothetical protein
MRIPGSRFVFTIGLVAMASLAACSTDMPTQPGRNLRPTTGPSRAMIFNDVKIPVAGTLANPCNGEPFAFSGDVHESFHVTFDAGGGLHVDEHFNAQGITGVGLISGDKYTGNEASHDEFNTRFGYEETFTHHFAMISNGSAPNFVISEVFHVTFNANGDLTVFFDNFSAECRG